MRNMKYCVCLLIIITCLKLSSSECTGGYEDGSLRLLNGSTMTSPNGQAIQICFGNTWIYICYQIDPDDKWDYKEANVACRELGYKSGMADSFQLSSTEQTRYIGYQTSCTGIENKLLHCGSRKLVNRGACYDKVSVQCSNSLARQSNCSYGDLRQAGSTQILEICLQGIWRKLCSKFWSKEQTQVVCRQLKQNPDTTKVMDSSNSLLEYHFHCSGEENSLTDCILTSLDSSYCGNALDNTYYNCSDLQTTTSSTKTKEIMSPTSTVVPVIVLQQTQSVTGWIGGFILGAVVGGVVVALLLLIVMIVLKRRQKENTRETTSDRDYNQSRNIYVENTEVETQLEHPYFTLEGNTQQNGTNRDTNLTRNIYETPESPDTATTDPAVITGDYSYATNDNIENPPDYFYAYARAPNRESNNNPTISQPSLEDSGYHKTKHSQRSNIPPGNAYSVVGQKSTSSPAGDPGMYSSLALTDTSRHH